MIVLTWIIVLKYESSKNHKKQFNLLKMLSSKMQQWAKTMFSKIEEIDHDWFLKLIWSSQRQVGLVKKSNSL